MTGRSGGLLALLGATLRDECLLAQNSKIIGYKNWFYRQIKQMEQC